MSILSFIFGCSLLSFAPSADCQGQDFLASSFLGDEEIVPDIIALLLSEANPRTIFPRLYDVDESKEALSQHLVALKDMFKSLPKNKYGNIALPAARYALHRYFNHRHRWFVHGLAPNSSETHVASTFRSAAQYDRKGVSLPVLTELAGTFDKWTRAETAMHLAAGYHVLKQSAIRAISGKVLKSLARDYMTTYISGESWAISNTRQMIEDNYQFLVTYNKDWPEIEKWIEQTTSNEAKQEPKCQLDDVEDCMFDFATSVRVVKKVVESYGKYNDHDCQTMKSELLKMEEPRTGRVRLDDFYKAGMTGAWKFTDKLDYLRDVGALDESKPSQPRVIITNYVTSWSNCLTPSKFYSVCCRDECEDFLRIIENQIAGSFGLVDQIIHLVRTHPTLRLHAPTHLGVLRRRLVEISLRYDEKVPIHGRLFAQWMHHVFPRTCSYPHEVEKKNPVPPTQWMAAKGQADTKASEEEMRSITRSMSIGATGFETKKSTDFPEDIQDIPWSDVEDSLVIARPTAPLQTPQKSNFGEILVVLEALAVIAVVVVMKRVAACLRRRKSPKYKDTSC